MMLGTRLTAATAGITQATIGVLYLPQLPETLIRRPLLPGQVSAVVYIESIGPLWSLMFFATAAMLLVASVRGKGFIRGHLSVSAVNVLYGTCILASALLTEPPVPVVAGTIATGFGGLMNLTIAIGCRDRGHR